MRKVLWFALFLAFTACLAASVPLTSRIYLENGVNLMLKGMHIRAEKEFKRAIKLYPEDVSAYEALAELYKRTGKYDKALVYLSRAIERHEIPYEALLSRGRIYCMKGEYNKAEFDFTHAADCSEEPVLAYANRAYTRAVSGRLHEALSDYTKAIRIKPEPDIVCSRGRIYSHLGLYKRAEQDFFSVLEEEPLYARAINSLGWLYATCPDTDIRCGFSALVFARRAVRMNPCHEYLDTLAAAYSEAGMPEKAIAQISKAIDLCDDASLRTLYEERKQVYMRGMCLSEWLIRQEMGKSGEYGSPILDIH